MRGVWLVVAVLGVRGPQCKNSPLQPNFGVREGGNPMVAVVATISSRPPVSSALCAPPLGVSLPASPPVGLVAGTGSYSGDNLRFHCRRGGPPRVGRVLHFVPGNREGFVLRQGVSSRIGLGLQGGEEQHSVLGH